MLRWQYKAYYIVLHRNKFMYGSMQTKENKTKQEKTLALAAPKL